MLYNVLKENSMQEFYNQLTEREKQFVDLVFEDARTMASIYSISLTNDDRAIRAVEAFAKFLIESRDPRPDSEYASVRLGLKD
jgi:hypothetical protein